MRALAPPDLRAISHFATPRRANSASFTTAGGKARIASSTLPSLALGVSASTKAQLLARNRVIDPHGESGLARLQVP